LVVLLFVISMGIDFLWFFVIYLNVWNREEYAQLAKWETGIHKTCLIVTIINFVLKIVSVVISFLFDPEVQKEMARNQATGANQLA
jgi:hypothetical protein